MRDRSSVVIIENEKVVLIQRNWDGFVYYVFPGGGIEKDEEPKLAAKREALEELDVEVSVKECISEVEFDGSSQFFFRSEILAGTISKGKGEEYTDETRGRGTYLPVWMELENLSSIDVRPSEVAIKIQSIYHLT